MRKGLFGIVLFLLITPVLWAYPYPEAFKEDLEDRTEKSIDEIEDSMDKINDLIDVYIDKSEDCQTLKNCYDHVRMAIRHQKIALASFRQADGLLKQITRIIDCEKCKTEDEHVRRLRRCESDFRKAHRLYVNGKRNFEVGTLYFRKARYKQAE